MSSYKGFVQEVTSCLKKEGMIFSWRGACPRWIWVYRSGNYYRCKTSSKSEITMCYVVNEKYMYSRLGTLFESRKENNPHAVVPSEKLKAEIQGKIGLTVEEYVELYHKGSIYIGVVIGSTERLPTYATKNQEEDIKNIKKAMDPKNPFPLLFN